MIVKPETFIKWHRTAFRIFWQWKSRKRGRPPLPKDLRRLIREMARENPTWGEERITDELQVKLGIRVSPRTVRKYLTAARPGGGSSQRWSTFVRNQANAIVACDFFVSVTATFRVLYVFVAMDIGTRRILHLHVTEHPTAEWTIQQFREFLAFDHPYRFLIHDRDGIFAPSVDEALNGFGVRVLKTPVGAPQANAFCERLVGSIRRECVDYFIPVGERHLKAILNEYVVYYNRGRPHSALGCGSPKTHPSMTLEFPGKWSIMLIVILCLFRFVRLLTSGHQAIAVENLALRLQLAAFKRKRKRPLLTELDRLFGIGLSRVWSDWREAVVFVQPIPLSVGNASAFEDSGLGCRNARVAGEVDRPFLRRLDN